jgi:hypothetical protein
LSDPPKPPSLAHRLPSILALWEPFLVEWLLVANSIWLGLSLLDGDFSTTAKSASAIVREVGLTPLTAAVLAFSAASFKLLGLFVCLLDGGSRGGMVLRMIGLGIGVFIWSTLGIGYMSNDQWLPTAVPTLSWGLASIVILIRTPALPGNRPR